MPGQSANTGKMSDALVAKKYKRDEKMLTHSFVSMNTPGALELFYRKVLVTERSEVLRAGISCSARPAFRRWITTRVK